jgi:hypothetical protein
MMRKVLVTGLAVAAAVLALRAIPDLVRYVKIAMM